MLGVINFLIECIATGAETLITTLIFLGITIFLVVAAFLLFNLFTAGIFPALIKMIKMGILIAVTWIIEVLGIVLNKLIALCEMGYGFFIETLDKKVSEEQQKTQKHVFLNGAISFYYYICFLMKFLFTKSKYFIIPFSIVVFLGLTWLIPQLFEVESFWILLKIFNKAEWYEIAGTDSAFQTFICSVAAIIIQSLIYILPAFSFTRIFSGMTKELENSFEWDREERRVQDIIRKLKNNTVQNETIK